MEALYKDKFIELYYDEKCHWIYANWQDYQTMESIKTGGEQMLNSLKMKKCNKVLNDNQLVKGTWSFATEWITTDWFPRMVGAGLKHFAWIYSPDIFSKFSTDKATKSNPNDIIQTFKSLNDGKSWLQSV